MPSIILVQFPTRGNVYCLITFYDSFHDLIAFGLKITFTQWNKDSFPRVGMLIVSSPFMTASMISIWIKNNIYAMEQR